jgi:hypothetical protein
MGILNQHKINELKIYKSFRIQNNEKDRAVAKFFNENIKLRDDNEKFSDAFGETYMKYINKIETNHALFKEKKRIEWFRIKIKRIYFKFKTQWNKIKLKRAELVISKMNERLEKINYLEFRKNFGVYDKKNNKYDYLLDNIYCAVKLNKKIIDRNL